SDKRSADYLALLNVEYVEGEPETYLLPISAVLGEDGDRIAHDNPTAVIARIALRDSKQSGVLIDATYDSGFASALLESITKRRRTKVGDGEVSATPTPAIRDVFENGIALPPAPVKGEQSNTSIIYGDRAILKLFRRVEQGISPELEIGRFLSDDNRFPHVPPVLGTLEYRRNGSEPWTLGVLHRLLPQSETAWQTTLDSLGRYFEKVLARSPDAWPTAAAFSDKSLVDLAAEHAPPLADELHGGFLQLAELLGQR